MSFSIMGSSVLRHVFLLSIATLTVSGALDNNAVEKREKKMFSLFSVVTFPNSQCSTASANSDADMKGVCLTKEECDNKGGSSDGNCAYGFGVCCVLMTSECTATVTNNCTYIQNPGYPSSYSTAGTCTLTLNAETDNICQIRLDFDTFQTTEPPTTGSCTTSGDTLTVTSPTGRSPPVLCGTLDGTHMYVETGRTQNTAAKIAILTGSASTARKWKIKVSQIDCDSEWRAPTDCVQYFTGTAGRFTTYNYPASGTGRMIQSQDYANCFRQEEGMCQIDISQSDTTSPDAFQLDAGAISENMPANCDLAFITIPTMVRPAAGNGEEFCGGVLSELNDESTAGVVRGTVTPFVVRVFSSATDQGGAIGFNLQYMQVPC